MTKTKPKTNKEVKDYIKKAISEITTFVPIIQMWQVIWEDDDTNPSNGEFSVDYEPANYASATYRINWLGFIELKEAIPPAYTKYIADSLMTS
jgi:hypothetical protein